MIQPCRRFLALDRTQRGLVIEAAGLMFVGWAGVRLFRLVTLRRALDRLVVLTSGSHPSAGEDVVFRVRRAVNAVAARIPAATCLAQALAVDVMPRRRQGDLQPAAVRSSIQRQPAILLEGHAWVECCGSTIDASDGRSAFSVPSR